MTWMSSPAAPRILFVIDYFHRTGGTEMHLARLAMWLAAHGIHCEIVVFDMGKNELIDRMRQAGVSVHHLPVAREYSPHALARAWTLARLIRRQRINIVQTYHQKSDTYGALVAWLAGVRHIVSSKRDTGMNRRPHHFFMNRRLRFLFERTIVVADAVADAVVASDHLDRRRLVKIYNGVDSERFVPPDEAQAAEAKRRFGFEPDDFVVGMVAGFRAEKEHRLLIESALAARATIPRLKLLLIGDGPLLPELRLDFASEDFVNFAGEARDVWNALRAMDVGCLISANEGFSNAIIEKMAAGLPMIVSDAGGNSEAVVEGGNGYIIPARDLQALTRAITVLHADAEGRRKMGHRSRQLVLENFSLEQMCLRHASLYRELCGGTAAAAAGQTNQ